MKKSSAALILDLNQNAPNKAVSPNTIGTAQGLDPKAVIELNLHKGVNHIVQQDSYDFTREFDIAMSMTTEPEKFMIDPLAVIFDPKLDPSGLQRFGHRCNSNDNKKYVLTLLDDFLGQIKGARTVREDALVVADELYTNGAKNSGTLYDKNNTDVRPGWVEFVAGSDGKRLVLGCIDGYGLLEISMITKRIHRCLQDGVAASINQAKGAGAGIGSYMVYSSSFSMYIAVQPGKKTIVLCTFPLGLRHKDLMLLTKNFHTLVLK